MRCAQNSWRLLWTDDDQITQQPPYPPRTLLHATGTYIMGFLASSPRIHTYTQVLTHVSPLRTESWLNKEEEKNEKAAWAVLHLCTPSDGVWRSPHTESRLIRAENQWRPADYAYWQRTMLRLCLALDSMGVGWGSVAALALSDFCCNGDAICTLNERAIKPRCKYSYHDYI